MTGITLEPMTEGQRVQLERVIMDCLRKSGRGDKVSVDRILARGDELTKVLDKTFKRLGADKVSSPRRPRTRRQLLAACKKAGIKLWGGTPASADCPGDQLPLDGTLPELLYDLDETFRLRVDKKPPFRLDYTDQKAMGAGLCSVEETLAFLLVYYKTHKRMPSEHGWLRCRNSRDSDCSLGVDWGSDDGLRVVWYYRGSRDANLGGLLLRK